MDSTNGWLMVAISAGSALIGRVSKVFTDILKSRREDRKELQDAQNQFRADMMLEVGRLRERDDQQGRELVELRSQLSAEKDKARDYEKQIAAGAASVVELTRLLGLAKERIKLLEDQLRVFQTPAPTTPAVLLVPAPGTVSTTHSETVVLTPEVKSNG